MTTRQRAEYRAEIEGAHGSEAAEVLDRIFAWSDEHGLSDTWETGSVHGNGYVPILRKIEWHPSTMGVSANIGHVWLSGETLQRHYPFRLEKRWNELLERVLRTPGIVETEQNIYPHVPLTALADRAAWDQFMGTMSLALEAIIRSAERGLQ